MVGDTLGFVTDDKVSGIVVQRREDAVAVGALVVDNRPLERRYDRAVQLIERGQPLFLVALQNCHLTGIRGKVRNVFRPDCRNGGRARNQYAPDKPLPVQDTGHTDGRERLAAAHLEQQAEAFAGRHGVPPPICSGVITPNASRHILTARCWCLNRVALTGAAMTARGSGLTRSASIAC